MIFVLRRDGRIERCKEQECSERKTNDNALIDI